MHGAAIRLIKTAIAAKFHHVTRAHEEVTRHEVQAGTTGAGEYTHRRLAMARETLRMEQAILADLEGSLRTLQAAEPVHAVHASYGPGQKVAVTGGPHKGDHGTIETIGDDGVLEVRLVAGPVVPVKPSSVRATN
ncbi:hypothetical protein SEA_LISARA_54 [Arthrobacter phage LiSara]|uniref:KOW domain-containing protein n=2 Tax=Laroyevirus TaxID=1982086 RepID=A0A0U4B4C8_9CAUD|nr:hypothetical protein FDH64_gp57 [Arthrobacter phage Laroye]YP_010082567.1 hypothetical protein KMD21_gp54 [Arthrobacter phage LiSara]ALY09582.1 hypothetical protein LAROYE_57 [Arthrobacter phage Laroye]ASR83638.1 hypothetical protein SEA_LISARA_54 [Arthrobacter phage LiSara]